MTENTNVTNITAAFRLELTQLLNKWSRENASNTPDFVLADLMLSSLEAYESAHNRTVNWHQHEVCCPKETKHCIPNADPIKN